MGRSPMCVYLSLSVHLRPISLITLSLFYVCVCVCVCVCVHVCLMTLFLSYAGADPLLLATLQAALATTADAALLTLWAEWGSALLPWLRPYLRALVRCRVEGQRDRGEGLAAHVTLCVCMYLHALIPVYLSMFVCVCVCGGGGGVRPCRWRVH
jgi:hypothetical protein